MPRAAKKLSVSTAAVVAIGAMIVGISATPASAAQNTLKFCSKGKAIAYVHVLKVPIPRSGGANTGEIHSPQLSNGKCWATLWDTHGQEAQVDVVQVKPDGGQRWLGLVRWNSKDGLRIHVSGSAADPKWDRWRS
jgi:hypothetical protein